MTKTYPNTSYLETLTFKTDAGALIDPESATITFLDPSRTVIDTLDLADLSRTEEGVYELNWLVPETAEAGSWIRKVSFSIDDISQVSEEPFNVSTQPYGTLSVVKRLCKLSDEDSQDSELMGYLDDATDWANTALRRAGEGTIPLVLVPSEIHRIVSYYAAGKFLQRDTEENKRHPYVADAKEELDAYIEAEYGKDSDNPPLIVTTASGDTTF